MRKEKEIPWNIHQIYVDDSHDFTQAELCLLLRLCHSQNEIFLTRDPAQGNMNDIKHVFRKMFGINIPIRVILLILFRAILIHDFCNKIVEEMTEHMICSVMSYM